MASSMSTGWAVPPVRRQDRRGAEEEGDVHAVLSSRVTDLRSDGTLEQQAMFATSANNNSLHVHRASTSDFCTVVLKLLALHRFQQRSGYEPTTACAWTSRQRPCLATLRRDSRTTAKSSTRRNQIRSINFSNSYHSFMVKVNIQYANSKPNHWNHGSPTLAIRVYIDWNSNHKSDA